MLTWRHPRLPPPFQETLSSEALIQRLNLLMHEEVEPLELPSLLKPGQSRQTLVTGNEGCVRYPT